MRRTTNWLRALPVVATAAAAILVSACIMPTASDIEKGLNGITLCPKPDPVAGLALIPSQVTVLVGTTVRVEAALTGNDGLRLFCAPQTSWSSAAPGIASVVDGVIMGVAPGKTYVRASAGGKTDSTAVTVPSTGSAQ